MYPQLFIAFILLVNWDCEASMKMPSSFKPISVGYTTHAPLTGKPWKQPQCKYEFTVPDKSGFCSKISAGLDQKVDNVKQDMDQTRLQIAKQNNAFLGQLHKLELEALNHASAVRGVQNEMTKIKAAVNGISHSGNTQKLENDLKKVRGQFNTAIQEMKDKLLNMSLLLQTDSVDQKKLYSNVVAQMNAQDKEVKNAAQKVADLEKKLASINSNPGSAGGVGKLGSDVLRLQSVVQGIKRDVIFSNQLQQQQFIGLEDKTNKLYLTLQNQSSELSNIRTTSQALYSRLVSNEHIATTTNNELKDLKTKWDPRFGNVEKHVTDVIRQISSMKSELTNVAGNLMNTRLEENKDKLAVNDLDISVKLLAHQLKDILVAVGNHTFTLQQVTKDLQSMKGSVSSVSPLAKGLQATINQLKQQTTRELQQEDAKLRGLQKTVTDISNKLKNMGGKNVTSSLTTRPSTTMHSSTLTKSTSYKVPTPLSTKKPGYPVPTLPHANG